MPKEKHHITLFAFGAGTSILEFAKNFGHKYHIYGTYRDAQKVKSLTQANITPILFDDEKMIAETLKHADAIIISTPPIRGLQLPFVDPCLMHYHKIIAEQNKFYCYLSTTGVYGNHDGKMIDEKTVPNPQSLRAKCRLQAEQEWQNHARNLCILRLAGIYGNERNQLKQLRADQPPKYTIRKNNQNGEPQKFNRIHETDIAYAIECAITKNLQGIYNLCDDEAAPPEAPLYYAAQLLNITPPPIKDYHDIEQELSPMQKSFYQDDKRVDNRKIKKAGVTLRYKNYREGLHAIYHNHFSDDFSDGTNFIDS